MPYHQVWEPNPSNRNLPVLDKLPPGVTEKSYFGSLREAWGTTADDEFRSYYHCPHCKGWIEGAPTTYGEHTLGPLSGRSGTVYACIRCGEEVAFNGLVS